ncbi:TFIIH complex serine/threonine-protein kinase subunit kin28 [Coemansia sp. RSA 989]|nr:putative serine/threonine protein kinase [Coemansia mojavensis]KAJ1744420.1 TFIIH complex serine/threonine-protein kinase subunit kin28 [Coemansia sp. RSA 1086]KAJ1753652.1 TFIIH complex serine/threonine-protein kinase subunit kin28 [Coemansia sp. RSA 1821]KAJ1868528.1 TFIIH complex serine/threonine-protein kinase subunit kin28 [Coemansia sp. RSA 989]KAJ1876138.1 TFIIH complex serine/threonine-protein kinase subunit kin28 [Coemansia sp. RSA 990]KAJ2632681.1 TFIIH complex serine/threonine-pr
MDASSKPIFGEDINKETESLYKKEKKLGEGTYAVVYLGRHIKTNRKVAIKKIKLGNARSGLDMSAIREVKALRELQHPNVIELIDVFSHKSNLNLVLEFLDMDLEAVIKEKSLVFMPADIKSWLMMALRGLDHCHKCWLLHRDLKPNNFLIASDGQLKLADFGLAREFGDVQRVMTSQTVTRWYRAPELLLGATNYSGAVDMWAMGCVFAELLLRTPYLAGSSDLDQLTTIFKARGTPTEDEWPGISKLPMGFKFEQHPRPPFAELFRGASDDALNLMNQMLLFNPTDRISAANALRHPYFTNHPRPTEPAKLPRVQQMIGAETADPEANGKKRQYNDAFDDVFAENGGALDAAHASKRADLRISSPA